MTKRFSTRKNVSARRGTPKPLAMKSGKGLAKKREAVNATRSLMSAADRADAKEADCRLSDPNEIPIDYDAARKELGLA